MFELVLLVLGYSLQRLPLQIFVDDVVALIDSIVTVATERRHEHLLRRPALVKFRTADRLMSSGTIAFECIQVEVE